MPRNTPLLRQVVHLQAFCKIGFLVVSLRAVLRGACIVVAILGRGDDDRHHWPELWIACALGPRQFSNMCVGVHCCCSSSTTCTHDDDDDDARWCDANTSHV